MTPGVAFFYGGGVGNKNVIGTMFQSFVTMGIISVLWVWIGFSLAFGKDANGSGVMGYPATYYLYNNVGAANDDGNLSGKVPITVFSMFQLMFAIVTAALIAGSLAERIDFHAWMIFVCFWHLLVYCPLAHIVWHPEGALYKWGYIDFGGGIPVEMGSGYSALAASWFIGPRKESTRSPSPANIPFIMLGTAIFWFGWVHVIKYKIIFYSSCLN
jgi:ammonium transporter, Amt family